MSKITISDAHREFGTNLQKEVMEVVADELLSHQQENMLHDDPSFYHYTSIGGLYGMLSFGEMWFTHYMFLNDPTEFSYMHDCGQSRFVNQVSEVKNLDEINFWKPNKTEMYRLLSGMAHFDKFRSKSFDPHVFCLSSQKDSLTQWRLYGGDGNGYSIGFSCHKLFEMVKLQSEEEDKPGFKMYPVVYGEDNINRLVDIIINHTVDALMKKRQYVSTEDDFDSYAIMGYKAMSFLLSAYGSSVKHDAYRDEAEWRIIMNTGNEYSPYTPGSKFTKVVLKGDKMVPVGFTRWDQSALREVWCGPCTGPKEHKALELFLSSKGLDVPVQTSSLPYVR